MNRFYLLLGATAVTLTIGGCGSETRSGGPPGSEGAPYRSGTVYPPNPNLPAQPPPNPNETPTQPTPRINPPPDTRGGAQYDPTNGPTK